MRKSDIRVRVARDDTGNKTDKLVTIAIPYGWKWTGESLSLVREVLESTDPMPRVFLAGPRSIEQEGAYKKLAKEFPKLSIKRIQAAHLGVQGKRSAPSCRIVNTYPDSPADLAGLKVGDTITTFDGKLVSKMTMIYSEPR